MNDSTFLYQCPACGNTWGWTYLFVVRCQRCKAYSSFAEAAVSASEVPATAGNYEMRPVCTPAADVSVAGRPATKANGGYSNGGWRLAAGGWRGQFRLLVAAMKVQKEVLERL